MTQRLDRPLSLRWRLPLSFAAVLFAVVAGITWIGWRGVRAAAFDNISERLDGAAGRLDALFEQSTRAILDDLARLADDTTLRRVLVAGAGAPAARAALATHDHAGLNLPVEVWDVSGRLRLASHTDTSGFRGFPSWAAGGRPLTTFFQSDSLVMFGAAAAVVEAGDTVGYAVEYRGAGMSGIVTLIRDLIGSNARYLLGVPGASWTDLDTVIAGPQAHVPDGVTIEADVPGRGRRVGQGRRLGATPWWIWVGFPREYVYRHAEVFLGVMSVVAVVMVGLGAYVGSRISGRITRPLTRLTAAAEGIAGGDFTQRAPAVGDDELQVLAEAFNRMAEEVEAGNRRLEARVAERTRELRDAQEALVRKERLAILGQLASGVGHELRNPLGVMNNAVYFLQATLPEGTPKVAEYLGILRQQIGLSERIVSDLLDFARIKPPQRQRVRVVDLVSVQLGRAAIPGRITVEQVLPDDLMTVVDPMQVGQVLLNLLVNAVQAIEGAGRLAIRGERVHAGVRVSVSDTGAGIAPEHLDKVFEPLFTTKARGIGLGLAVSRGLAEANGGTLRVTATGPAGTTFALDLPDGAGSG